jgi:hypothetical protein
MKIGIAHFTDIHFTTKTNIDYRLASCIGALKNDLYGASRLYFVISGDIAYSGLREEYALAKKFFNLIKQLLEKEYPGMAVKMVIVPGNHDCNFAHNTQARQNSIDSMRYSSLGDDNSVVDICLNVQQDFWEYYLEYNPVPEDKLFYQVLDTVGDVKICFHCINTSWLSEIHEKPGSLFFPVKRYDAYDDFKDFNINIGVWHHPYNWINPSTAENNKKEFQRFTERIAPVHFLGHEHEEEFYRSKNMDTGNQVNLLSGKVFNDDKAKTLSGFQTVVIDVDGKSGKLKKYSWKKDFYDSIDAPDVSFMQKLYTRYEISPDFYKSLEETRIPLVIGDRKKVRLSEIYVFPDIEVVEADTKKFDNYFDAERLLREPAKYCVLTGEDQIGKTSLLYSVFFNKYKEGSSPVMISGDDIKGNEFLKTIKRAFKKQYTSGDKHFESYLQLDKSKKVLLVDDYQKCKVAPAAAYLFFKEAMEKFEMVLVTIDSSYSNMPLIQAEFKEIEFLRIKPLGYSKQNELVEKYLYIKNHKNSEYDELSELQATFDQVQGVLGDKLIPQLPVFILSILQSLDYNSSRQSETSFSYCYQTLIHYSLHKADVPNDNIDSYFNFLIELAYHFVKHNIDVLSEDDFMKFYRDYKDRFIAPQYVKLFSTLRDSKILVFDNDEIYFGYEYILYFLSAKKIADMINSPEAKKIINKLFNDVHEDKSGNILVFITHHCKDMTFIEESLLNSMVILEKFDPITLALDDPFYSHIKEIVRDLSDNILETNKNPNEERRRQLKDLDREESKMPEKADDDTFGRDILPIKQAYKSIAIVGQIVRNRKGSIEIPKLKEMIREVYTTGFRTINYSSDLLVAAKEKIIHALNAEDEILDANKSEITKAVNEFITTSCFEYCLATFGKIIGSMGIKDLKNLFNDVSEEMNTPAAKLVTFSINSYYGSINEPELKSLVLFLKGNPVALSILRSRVKSYVYNKKLDIKTKQRFAKLLDMEIPISKPIILS